MGRPLGPGGRGGLFLLALKRINSNTTGGRAMSMYTSGNILDKTERASKLENSSV